MGTRWCYFALRAMWIASAIIFCSGSIGYCQRQEDVFDLVRNGYKHNVELIKDCQVEFKVAYPSGNTREGTWYYRPGSERIDLRNVTRNESAVFLYNQGKGSSIRFETGIMTQYSSGVDVPYVVRKVTSALAPSCVFLHPPPLGLPMDEILSRPHSVPVVEEQIDGMRCYRIDVPRFGKMEYFGIGTTNYDYLGYRIWFSRAEGFMPKKIEVYVQNALHMMIGPVLYKEYEGTWLPVKTKILWQRSSSPPSTATLEYNPMVVNGGLSEKTFAPVIPKGVQILDLGAHIEYPAP